MITGRQRDEALESISALQILITKYVTYCDMEDILKISMKTSGTSSGSGMGSMVSDPEASVTLTSIVTDIKNAYAKLRSSLRHNM